MRSIILTSFFLLFLSDTVFGQPIHEDFGIEYGPFFKVSKRSIPVKYIGADENVFYMQYALGKGGFGENSLQKFGYDLQPKGEIKLSQEIQRAIANTEILFKIDDKMYQFLSSKFVNQKRIYLQEVDLDRWALKAPKMVALVSESSARVNSSMAVHFSDDFSMVSLAYNIVNTESDQERIGICVFNGQMEERWKYEFELPYDKELLQLTTSAVTRDGNIFILGKRYFEKAKDKRHGSVNYKYILFELNQNGSIDSLNLELPDKFLSDMKLEIGQNNTLAVSGFYSEKDYSKTAGIFYAQIDAQTKVKLSETSYQFSEDFILDNSAGLISTFNKQKLNKGKTVELPYFAIDELINKKGGGSLLIAEKRRIYSTYVYSPYGGGSSTTHYDFDDILVANIDTIGDVNWVKRIAKNQHTINDNAYFSSYSTAYNNDNLYLIFNDNPLNINYNGSGMVHRMVKSSSTMVMVVRVRPNGTVEKTALFDRSDADSKVRPSLSSQVSENEMLLFGHKGLKNQRFILLKFN